MDDLSLVNIALNEVGQTALRSLDTLETVDGRQTGADVQTAVMQLDRIKRAVLSEADWNCARKRKQLVKIGTGSTDNGSLGEWNYAYRLPPDCLVVRRFVSSSWDFCHAKFSVEIDSQDKRILYTNHGNDKIVYTCNMTDVNRWSATLYDACGTRLSVEFATAIARDSKLAMTQMEKYLKKIELASGVDEAEGGIEVEMGRDLVSVRGHW